MTTAVEREISGRAPGTAAAKMYGGLDDLIGSRKPRTKEVEIRGKVYILRELNQGEVDDIQAETMAYATDGTGTLKGTLNMKGNRARTVAYSMVNRDGSPVLSNPGVEWTQLQKLYPSDLALLYAACDELSTLTPEAQKDEGKNSGATSERRA